MNLYKTTVSNALTNNELYMLLSADPKYTLDTKGNYIIGPNLRLMGTTQEYVDPIDYIAVINAIESIYLDYPRKGSQKDELISMFTNTVKQLIASNIPENIYFAARIYMELAKRSADPLYIIPGIDITIQAPLDQALTIYKTSLQKLNKYSGKELDDGLWQILKIQNNRLIPEKKLTSLGDN